MSNLIPTFQGPAVPSIIATAESSSFSTAIPLVPSSSTFTKRQDILFQDCSTAFPEIGCVDLGLLYCSIDANGLLIDPFCWRDDNGNGFIDIPQETRPPLLLDELPPPDTLLPPAENPPPSQTLPAGQVPSAPASSSRVQTRTLAPSATQSNAAVSASSTETAAADTNAAVGLGAFPNIGVVCIVVASMLCGGAWTLF